MALQGTAASISRKRNSNRSLLEYANQNRNEGFFNDVNIKVANECFPASRMILSCFSHVFERMFKVEMKERYEQTVEVKQVDEKSMKIVIDYIYTGRIDINNENVMNLLSAADYLQLEEVKEFCFEFLISILACDTWFAILTAATLYRNESLHHHLHQFLSVNLGEVSTSKDFKALSKGDLISLIENLFRDKVKEELVYNAIVIWTNAVNTDDRKNDFPDLLQLVQFQRISPDFCDNIVSKDQLVVENNHALKIVMQAYSRMLKSSNATDLRTIISFGGRKTPQKCMQVFSLDEKKQLHLPDLPMPIKEFQTLKTDQFAFCMGGLSENIPSDKVRKIDVKEQNSKWQEVASLNQSRYSFGSANFCGMLVAAGGTKGPFVADTLTSVEVYLDAFDEWRCISPLNHERLGLQLVCCKGCLYAIGGSYVWGEIHSSVERLSSLKSKWKFVQPMQTARSHHAAVSYNGCIFVFGGENANQKLKSVEKYDPVVNGWSYVSDMSVKRSRLATCVINGKIYVVGGIAAKGKPVKTIECYDPAKDSWSIVGKTTDELQEHSVMVI